MTTTPGRTPETLTLHLPGQAAPAAAPGRQCGQECGRGCGTDTGADLAADTGAGRSADTGADSGGLRVAMGAAMSGPFAAERDAAAIVGQITRRTGYADLPVATVCVMLLRDACESAGVVLGDFDRTALDRLASADPAVSAAVAGMIRRATNSGAAEGQRGVRLLADLRRIFGGRRAMGTGDILAALHATGQPWTGAVPVDARGLARMLAAYGVTPVKVKAADGRALQGYRAEHLADAWTRFLPDPSHPAADDASPDGQQ